MLALQNKIYKLNVTKGFWDGEFNQKEKLILVASEVIEALEEVRKHAPSVYVISDGKVCPVEHLGFESFVHTDSKCGFLGNKKEVITAMKPEGELMEVADVVIRCLDSLAHFKIAYEAQAKDSFNVVSNPANFYYDLLTVLTARQGSFKEKLQAVIVECEKYCLYKGWDLKTAMDIKVRFNETRAYKHGKKF